MASAARRMWWRVAILVAGLLSLLAALLIVVLPGVSIVAQGPMGQPLSVDLDGGAFSVYYDGDYAWRNVECEVERDGEVDIAAPDMTQQDLYFPKRWHPKGVISDREPATLEVTCHAAGNDGLIAVAPSFSIVNVVGVLFFGFWALVLVTAGMVLVVMGRRAGRLED